MRAVIQRVNRAAVKIGHKTTGKIGQGLVILLGIESEDRPEDIAWLCRKIIKLRLFSDEHKAMNLSLKTIEGEAMIISQFTLHARTKKGNRPNFIKAAKPEIAKPLYEEFIKEFNQQFDKPAVTGKFGADMQVSLCNDGPVTLLIDSKKRN